MDKAQVFQTDSRLRKRSFQWTGRIVLVIFVFLLSALVIAMIRGSKPSLPNLEQRSTVYRDKLDNSNFLTIPVKENKKYKGFKTFLLSREAENNGASAFRKPGSSFIRAAFYTPWTSRTSLPDLQQHADALNTIFPEWFFLTKEGQIDSRIDNGLAVMRSNHLSVIPMLSNFNSLTQQFDASLIHPFLADTAKGNVLISQLADLFQAKGFQGINIDFEELGEPTNDALVAFISRLATVFHAHNLSVSIDVTAKNEDYDCRRLAEHADYLVLMAYDQYNNTTGPGPVSAQQWIEENVEWLAAKVPAEKIILGIGAYGYDWRGGKQATAVSYPDVINAARMHEATIHYDNNSYNLFVNYYDDNDSLETKPVLHDIWFNDAATIFNTLRYADEFGLAGSAMWRLGSEDQRVWHFYDRNLDDASLISRPFDFTTLQYIPVPHNSVGFTGEGEVLDIQYDPQPGKVSMEIDSTDKLIAEQHYDQLPSGFLIRKFAEDTTVGKGHKLILTFDDGPDPTYTPAILDILEKENVPASFFIVGLQAEKNIPILKRIYADGDEIGNHTFTHSNIATMSPARASVEMKLTRLLIECITGRSTVLFRAPYNADSQPQTFEELEPISRSRKDNYLTIGESIDPMDWQKGVTADSIVDRTIRQVLSTNASIILMHDAGGETRQATVEALPRIIRYFKERGYQFTTIANLMGKSKDDVMPIVPASRDGWLIKLNFFAAETTYWGSQFLFALFLIGILLSIGRMTFMGILATLQKRKEPHTPVFNLQPPVSIIVPAYNEEITAVRTIESLLQQDYPALTVLFVDDGSKDNTYQAVRNAYGEDPRVRVLTKANGGKASALNFGIAQADTEFVVCIDADTQLRKNAVTELMKRFASFGDKQVGAVAGNVKVGNEVNLITRWQSIEYITSQNFDRRAFELLNAITVVPGALGAFRKSALIEAGGFSTDTLAEDCDLTMRLLKTGYRVNHANKAVSYTEAPETLRQFLRQRFRWSFGVMQSFWKNRDALFNRQYGNFGMIAMPNILIFQLFLPILAPLADLVLVFSMIAAAFGIIPAGLDHFLLYYVIFTLVDMAGAALAFHFEDEEKNKYARLVWMIPQRFMYRQLMYYIFVRSFSKALKGEMQGWGVLKRTGNVQQTAIT